MSVLAEVIIEIERHSNVKWEYDRNTDSLFLDRILQYPYFYPYAYGFFPETLGNDGDELDVLLITDRKYSNYSDNKTRIRGYIVGGLMMHDEKGADEKIFVVPEDELEQYLNKPDLEKKRIENDIIWFFSNYKSNDAEKWSRVDSLLHKQESIDVYTSSQTAFMKKRA